MMGVWISLVLMQLGASSNHGGVLILKCTLVFLIESSPRQLIS